MVNILRRIMTNHLLHFTLLTVSFPAITLAATLFAPTVEHGILATSISFTLLFSLFAIYNKERMGKGLQLAVCCMLATCLVFVTASLLDIVDFSFPGKAPEGITLLLAGESVFLLAVAVVADWLNWRMLIRHVWWFAAAAVFWLVQSDAVAKVLVEFPELRPMELPFICLAGFCLLARYKQRFTDNRYLALLLTIITALLYSMPSSKGKLVLSLMENSLFFLFGLLYLLERQSAVVAGRILAAFIMLLGALGLIQDLLHKGLGINEVIAGFPGLLAFMIGIVWLWQQRYVTGKLLLTVSILTYYAFGLYCILPDEYAPVSVVLCLLLVFVLTCAWSMRSSELVGSKRWRQRLRLTSTFCGVLLLVVVNFCLIAIILLMLTANIGPARLLASLNGTPLWPGDRIYAAIALKDEYFWQGETTSPANDAKSNNIDGYITKALPKRDRYSFVTTTSEEKDRSAGFVTSYGFDYKRSQDSLKVLTVNPGTDAWKSGLQRGDRIISINGKPVGRNSKRIHSVTEKADKRLRLQVASVDGRTREINIKIDRHMNIPSFSRIFETATRTKVGYLYFPDFDEWQEKQLEDIFSKFKKAGVQGLVLDLRYNGGGRVSVARSLAGYLVGAQHKGKVIFADRHNSRYRDRNREDSIPEKKSSLNLRRVVVLTTGDTASASEAIISGLKPYLQVVTVGETTYGKPFFMSPIKCGKVVLELVTGIGTNANGEMVPESGIRPDYIVKDDLTHQLGDPEEKLLKKALEVM
jgi:carboxyl-terminal processing protease